MKTFFLIFCFLCFSYHIYTQETWQCGVTETLNPEIQNPYIGNIQQNVLVVYIDFPDGRVQPGHHIPTDDQMLSNVQNIDAVCNLGYDAAPLPLSPYAGWPTHARKYTYFDIWDRFFSDNVYIGSRHPDWESHGQFGYPLASGGTIPNNMIPGDTAKGYGSVKDYFREVSYNNLTLNPYNIRPGYNEDPDPRYKTGIINNISSPDIWGNRYLIPVRMPLNKTQYNFSDGFAMDYFVNFIVPPACITQTGFDINTFCLNPLNKVIIVYSGSNPSVGGIAFYGNNRCIVREKLTSNTEVYGNQRSVIDGISVTCHEYGHLLGWGHSTLGNYCIMNTGTDNQNCPSHPNMVYKLLAGWVNPNNVIKINTNQSINSLSPSILNQGACALISIYGKAGFGDNFEHSEYFVLENRRMIRDDPDIKFDKKLVWRTNLLPPTPSGFTGGILIYHYNGRYNDFSFPCNDCDWDKYYKGVYPRASDEPFGGDGDSKHFFGVNTSIGPPVSNIFQDRTNSSFNLPTGIQITNITENGNNFSFNVNYNAGEPPNYNTVIYDKGSYANPLTLAGNIFYHSKPAALTHLNIQPGCNIEFPKPVVFEFKGIKADGNTNNPIIFNSCGYGSNRTQMGNIKVSSPSALGSVNEIIFRNCQFLNVSSENKYINTIYISNINATNPAPITIENNTIPSGKRILITSNSSSYNNVQLIRDNTSNVQIAGSQSNPTLINGEIQVPSGYSLTFNTGKYLFNSSGVINCYGSFSSVGNSSSHIQYEKQSAFSNWAGINIFNNISNIQYNDLKYALNGITINSPLNGTLISNCTFDNNFNNDISVSSFTGDISITISNNSFNGSRNNGNLILNNGSLIGITYNNFTNVNNKAINSNFVIDPYISNNSITGVAGGSGSIGIHQFNSGGTLRCNDIQNLSNGILLDNSSPVIFNNSINSNVVGLYLTNGSTPVMSPSFSQSTTLINAGYNSISNSANEEIYCNNNAFLPVSLPLLQGGRNSIYDISFPGCLINTNINTPNILNAEFNYWGANPPHPNANDFCPTGSVNYSNFLFEPSPPPEQCNSTTIAGDNGSLSPDLLLLGSANIDYFNLNYNSSGSKYINYINTFRDPVKLILPLNYLFYSTAKSNNGFNLLINFYDQISQQYINDSVFSLASSNLSSKSKVEQTSYEEALSDYNNIINTSNNQPAVFYAYINKLRVLGLMFDTTYGNGGNFRPIGNYQNLNNKDIKDQLIEFVNIKFTHEENPQNSRVKNTYGKGSPEKSSNTFGSQLGSLEASLKNIDISNVTRKNIKLTIDKIINIKLQEYSLQNYIQTGNIPDIANNNKYILSTNNPVVFKLYDNYPNPFNPLTQIKFDIPKQSNVTIKVFDILGKEVMTLVNEIKEAGYHSINFDGSNISSGVYFYRINVCKAGSSAITFSDVKKMVLIK